MEIFKDPIISIFCVSVLSTLLLHLCSNTGFVRSLRILSGIVVLLSVINFVSPILSLINKISFNFDDYQTNENIKNEMLIEDIAKNISVYTKDLICESFDFDNTDVYVSVTLSENEDEIIEIKHITVMLYGESYKNAQNVAELVNKTLFCECTVSLMDKKE